jgi:hypothetical protein
MKLSEKLKSGKVTHQVNISTLIGAQTLYHRLDPKKIDHLVNAAGILA